MRTAVMSRLAVMCLVCVMVWKETLQQIPPNNHIETRSKRYHESDQRNYVIEMKENETIKDKSNAPVVPTHQGNQARSLNLGVPKKTYTRTIIPQSKIIRVRPINANTNNINNPSNHKPYVYVNNNELPKIQSQSKNTTTVIGNSHDRNIQERELEVEKIVDTREEDTVINTKANENNNNLLETKVTETVDKKVHKLDKATEGNTEVLKTCTNNKSKTTRNTSPSKKSQKKSEKNGAKSGTVSENQVKNNKSSKKFKTEVSNATDASVSYEANKANELDILNKQEEKSTEKSIIQVDNLISIDQSKTTSTEKQAVIEQPTKHPFLAAIQNDKYLTCSPSDEPKDYMKKAMDDNGTPPEIKIPAFDTEMDDVVTDVGMTQDDLKADNEDLLVRHSKYDEVQEITYSNALKKLQIDNYQEKICADPYYSYQGPYYYHQEVSSPNYADYEINNNQFYYTPDEQKVEQINGATVTSHKNYYKTPKPYWSNNRNYNYPSYYHNYNSYYGNNNQRQLNNNYDVCQPASPTRIWRSWKNTEYLTKSKNALQKLRNENINNSLMNPSIPNNINIIQRHNAVVGGF